MDKNLEINSKAELYKRLTPALNCKIRELNRSNIYHVKNIDIWNYLLKTKWEKETGLDLSIMVDDILNLDNKELERFINSKSNSYDIKKESNEIEVLQ